MLATGVKKLRLKLLTLGVLVAGLFTLQMLAPRDAGAQTDICAYEVHMYCISQNRPTNPTTCECDETACLNPLVADCAEVGKSLNTATCTCVSSELSAINYCNDDPYALGCPRAFDTVFAGVMRVQADCNYPGASSDPYCNPMLGGGSADICSFDSYAWCTSNGGSWSSYGCSCSGVVSSNSTAQQTCANNGGTWYNPGNSVGGGRCYNPSGISWDFQCGASSINTLSGCVGVGGRYNPYNCKCEQ